MLSKHYDSTEIVLTSRDTHQVVEIQTRDFCLDGYTILLSDLINEMKHMRISGIEPSSVIILTMQCI